MYKHFTVPILKNTFLHGKDRGFLILFLIYFTDKFYNAQNIKFGNLMENFCICAAKINLNILFFFDYYRLCVVMTLKLFISS